MIYTRGEIAKIEWGNVGLASLEFVISRGQKRVIKIAEIILRVRR